MEKVGHLMRSVWSSRILTFRPLQLLAQIRMFTAKVGQMDYRQSLKQVKKFELEDKEIEKVSSGIRSFRSSFSCPSRRPLIDSLSNSLQEKPEWAAVSSGKSIPTESDRE